MICNLCLELNENAIDISGVESSQLNVLHILRKYFQFCFEDGVANDSVCKKCWWKVEQFHEFYIQIEDIHNPVHGHESIFVDSILNEDALPARDSKFESTIKLEPSDDFNYDDENVSEGFKSETSDRNKCNVSANIANSTTKREPKKQSRDNKEAKDPIETLLSKKSSSTAPLSYQCDTCKQHFFTHGKLLRHIKQNHLILPFQCKEDNCVESFAKQTMLDRHYRRQHTTKPCSYCGKSIRAAYIRAHMRKVHEENSQVVCDLCGKISNSQRTHKEHFENEHTGQERIQCDICGEWAKHKRSLRAHMLFRHIQGPQTCDICGKVTANKKVMAKHKRNHVAEYKERHKCNVCGKGFPEKAKLKEHSYIHSGITDAYQCNLCFKSFRFSSSMYAHRKKAHPQANDEQGQ